ncbi:hypothetical protein ACS0TY_032040 [Phlomoides rotata]
MEDNSEKTKLKFLNQQIYDYLVSKNLPSTAEEFAKETNLQAQRDVALDDEYLSDFWSLFRDIECSRPGYNPAGNQASTSTPYLSSTPLPPAFNPSTSPSRRPNPERGPGSSRSNPMTSRPRSYKEALLRQEALAPSRRPIPERVPGSSGNPPPRSLEPMSDDVLPSPYEPHIRPRLLPNLPQDYSLWSEMRSTR